MENNFLFVTTGQKKDVFKSTYILDPVTFWKSAIAYGISKESYAENLTVFVLTEENCIDFLSTIKSDWINIYQISSENMMILLSMDFKAIINRANTELSKSFINLYTKINSHKFKFDIITILPFADRYCFEKARHPIDIIHSRIKKGKDSLIGISIGEGSNPYTKPTVSFITDLIKQINTAYPFSKIAIFGDNIGNIKTTMLKRSISKPMVLFTDIEDSVLLAQALEFCDVFISFDGFLMNLSVAVGTNTIGLFANTDPKETGQFKNLIKLTASWSSNLKSVCNMSCQVEKNGSCEAFEHIDENCFSMFDINEIIKRIKLFMETMK